LQVDWSGRTSKDCGGLGAWIALSNATRGGKCQDTPVESEDPAEHVLNLMEAQLAFEIVTRRPGC